MRALPSNSRGLSALEISGGTMKNDDISAAAFHRFISQPAFGRSSALPLLAAFLVLSLILGKLHLHSLFFRPYYDRLMLRKRTVIESVNDFLKNICDADHSRHRSVTNFLVNLISALAAYSFLPKKPSICSSSDVPQGILCLTD